MGLMKSKVEHSRLVVTPHPVLVDGQTNIAAELTPGETLASFLRRSVPGWSDDAWEVRVNGVTVPYEAMERLRPKDGAVIEVRGVVNRQALYIVAMAALTYFTVGVGTTAGGAASSWWGAGAAAQAFGGGAAGAMFASAVYVGGSVLINKVLGPKPMGASGQGDQNSVYSIGAARNQARQHQPLPLVFGRVRFAPDLLSLPYAWYEGNDQYLGMVLTPGANVHRVEPLMNGDTQLASFEGVQVYHNGFGGMQNQNIPLYSDADTIQGGELNKDRSWVQRATPARTVRIQINLEYILGDQNSKGRPHLNLETVEVQYRAVDAATWLPLLSRNFANSSYDTLRATLARDVDEGQYEVRVRILGRAMDGGGSNGRAQFQWTTMTAVQADTATYDGIPRIGVRIKATGQLNGAPDELRCVAYSAPVPVWKESGWITEETSNPGAQILAYARGINDEIGVRIAGIGLSDDMIDVPALQAFMLHCASNSFAYNFVVKEARSHDEMLNALAMAGFGQISWAGGKLSVVWAADEQPVSGVVNMATIKRGQFQVDYTLANAADGIEYSYYDAEDWRTKTIRVQAPGVTTMLNPATLTGEGVTDEAHAAQLARWHLAQSLYQYKEIGYSTDIEHLSYRRMSLLSLSHDLTQWGYSGRVQAASTIGGVTTLTLDDAVPPNSSGNAYIGVRIPGDRTYRVLGATPQRVNLLQRSTTDNNTGFPFSNNGTSPAYTRTFVPGPFPGATAFRTQREEGGGSGGVFLATNNRVTFQPSETFTVSFWIRSETRTAHRITATNFDARSFSVSKEWQRKQFTYTPESTAVTPSIGVYNNTGGGADFELFGMQIEYGDRASDYAVANAPSNGRAPSNKVVLTGAWPSDAPLPGNSDGNPAHDTLWCYDFKATPGYRVRVVSIEPESDLKGASVAVVPEGPEFWNYVKTGEYIPAPNESLLQTRPVASNLIVTEQQVVQGDTVFAELTATFDITGPVGNVVVLMSNENGELREVAQTNTRTATWRIPGAGTYTIVVRPFSPDGNAGVAASLIFSTTGADAPPVLIDLFSVEERSGGVRLYTWGWLNGTAQSADFAGVEIRYIAGSAPAPDWATMAPVGDNEGYHTAPFEAVVPASGEWTFAARSRNTSGTLSAGMRVVTRTLGANLGEQIGGIGESIDEVIQRQVEEQQRLDQEVYDRAQADLQVARQAGLDATAKANAARDAAIEQVDLLAAEIAEIVNAPTWDEDAAYIAGWLVKDEGALYRARESTQGSKPSESPDQWEKLGDYSSLGEALAANIAAVNMLVSDLAVEVSRLNAVIARMPTGAGKVASEASVIEEVQARISAVSAQASRIDSLMARMPSGDGLLATAQSVSVVDGKVATVDGRVSAVVSRTDTLEAKVPITGRAANEASVTAANTARADGDTALGRRIDSVTATANGAQSTATQALTATGQTAQALTQVRAEMGGVGGNMIRNPNAEADLSGWGATTNIGNPYVFGRNYGNGWTLEPGTFFIHQPNNNNSQYVDAGQTLGNFIDVIPGERWCIQVLAGAHRCGARLFVYYLNASGGDNGNSHGSNPAPGDNNIAAGERTGGGTIGSFKQLSQFITIPAGAARMRVILRKNGTNIGSSDSFVFFTRFAANKVTADQTAVPAWSNSAAGIATATRTLSVGLDSVDGRLKAVDTMVLDVNGNISGTRNENDGARSIFSVLSDVFQLIASGTVGMEIRRRGLTTYFMRFYAANVQLVFGINFGQYNDLMLWHGPNVGESNCHKNNATTWFDNVGGGYFGGQLSSGSLTTRGSFNWSGLAPGEKASITHSNSSGRPKQLIIGMNYGARDRASFGTSAAASTFRNNQLPNVSGSITFRLFRGTTSIGTWTVSGTSYANDPWFLDTVPGQWIVEYGHNMGTSQTLADTSTGTGNIVYSVQIVTTTGSFKRNNGVISFVIVEQ